MGEMSKGSTKSSSTSNKAAKQTTLKWTDNYAHRMNVCMIEVMHWLIKLSLTECWPWQTVYWIANNNILSWCRVEIPQRVQVLWILWNIKWELNSIKQAKPWFFKFAIVPKKQTFIDCGTAATATSVNVLVMMSSLWWLSFGWSVFKIFRVLVLMNKQKLWI